MQINLSMSSVFGTLLSNVASVFSIRQVGMPNAEVFRVDLDEATESLIRVVAHAALAAGEVGGYHLLALLGDESLPTLADAEAAVAAAAAASAEADYAASMSGDLGDAIVAKMASEEEERAQRFLNEVRRYAARHGASADKGEE